MPAKKATADRRRAAPKRKPARARKPAAKLQPQTEPAADPSLRYIWVPRTSAGVKVDHDNALTFSALWACVRVITSAIAPMAWCVMQREPDGGKAPAPDHQVDWILGTQPNPEMEAFAFRETLLGWALTWGNGYAEIERDMARRPVWLWPIAPDRVQPGRDQKGRLVYEVHNQRQPNSFLDATDMFHLKGLGWDGLVGYSVVHMAAQSIGLGLATEQFGATYFGNNAIPGGVLEHPGRLTDPARKNLRESFQAIHGGSGKAHGLAILEEGMKYNTIGIPPEDSQFLQTRRFQPIEICRFFGVQPHKVADLTAASFNNIESEEKSFVVDTLLPWMSRLEQQANVKLFGQKQRGTYFTKINPNYRLRGDAASRGSYYQTMTSIGAFSINDVLDHEELNRIGPLGDKRLVQLNLTTLEKAGEDPPQPEQSAPPPAQPGGPPPPEKDGEPADDQEAMAAHAPFRRLFAEATARVLARERNMAGKAQTRFAAARDGFAAWLEAWLPEQREYARKALLTPAEALAEVAAGTRGPDPEAASTVVALCVDRYAAAARVRLLAAFDRGEPIGHGAHDYSSLEAVQLARQTALAARLGSGDKALVEESKPVSSLPEGAEGGVSQVAEQAANNDNAENRCS